MANFRIKLDTAKFDIVKTNLEKDNFKVETISDINNKDNVIDRSSLLCSKRFTNFIAFANQLPALNEIPGIERVYTQEVEEVLNHWYNHWVVPMIFTTVFTGVAISVFLYTTDPNASLFDYFILILIPTVMSFGTQAFAKLS